jgi:dihydrofolate synthase/folylpolyglutamate synthase
MISKDDFAHLMTQIAPVAEEIGKSDLGEVTEFEAKTMAAFLYFSQQKVDIAVLEVGMGGRYDATNLIHPMAAVITNVTLDHMERLGDTVAAIAREKAGIIKPSCTVITCAQDLDALQVISDKCAHTGAELWRVSPAGTNPVIPRGDFSVQYVHNEGALAVRSSDWAIGGLCPSLKGEFQFANASAAVAAVMSLERFDIRMSPYSIFAGISEAYIPGRLEVIQDKPLLVLDGAHNPDAAQNLAQTLPNTLRYKRMILVVGMLDNHAPDGVLSHLAVKAAKVIATQSTWFKARKAEDIAESARNYCLDVETVASVPGAVKRALQIAQPDDLVLVTGSFYTIGEVPRPAE